MTREVIVKGKRGGVAMNEEKGEREVKGEKEKGKAGVVINRPGVAGAVL